MADRSLKGTYVRNSWDFYESGGGFAAIQGQLSAGQKGPQFINNMTGPGNLDLYRAEISLSAPLPLTWWLTPPGGQIAGGPTFVPGIFALDPSQKQPLGGLSFVFAINTNVGYPIKTRPDGVTYDSIELQSGGPFCTLPPGWSLTVLQTLATLTTVSFVVWYQVITDHLRPAL